MLEKLVRTILTGIACLTINGCGNVGSSTINDVSLQYDSMNNEDNNAVDSNINEFEVKEEYDQTLPCVEKTYFKDKDNDGFGVKSENIQSCEQPSGYVTNFLDCDDNNFDINPKAKEVCNGVDDSCNGIIGRKGKDYLNVS